MEKKNNQNLVSHQISDLINTQREFMSKVLGMLALQSKTIYSREEAAMFLNLEPDYIYQLRHQGKLKAIKKKGQKKLYFKKQDLEAYLLSSIEESGEDDFLDEDFENEITSKWKK